MWREGDSKSVFSFDSKDTGRRDAYWAGRRLRSGARIRLVLGLALKRQQVSESQSIIKIVVARR